MKHTAIFDIGKTNKKFIIFDDQFSVVHSQSTRIPTVIDEDGVDCDDLPSLLYWMDSTLQEAMQSGIFNIHALNFSTFGASFVYVDANGLVLSPLYSYLKPVAKEVDAAFNNYIGNDIVQFEAETASPFSGHLNSGLQVLTQKIMHSERFAKTKWALHFPQFLSYYYTKIAHSDYTSIGSHTGLWHYALNQYHQWINKAGIAAMLPPITTTDTTYEVTLFNKKIEIGVGIHDSSAALLPYILASKEPFVLLSTGTWNLNLNPFDNQIIGEREVAKGGLYYMQVTGAPVLAQRIFLGFLYEAYLTQIATFYGKSNGELNTYINTLDHCKAKNNSTGTSFFNKATIYQTFEATQIEISQFQDLDHAVLTLVGELAAIQANAISEVNKRTHAKNLYIDGGFTANTLFKNTLKLLLPDMNIYTSDSSAGSALGAALIVNRIKSLDQGFLENAYGIKKV